MKAEKSLGKVWYVQGSESRPSWDVTEKSTERGQGSR